MAGKFRAMVVNQNRPSIVKYGPIRETKPEAVADLAKLKSKHPDLLTGAVIMPNDPTWSDEEVAW